MLRAGFGEEGNMLKKREGRKTLCKTSSSLESHQRHLRHFRQSIGPPLKISVFHSSLRSQPGLRGTSRPHASPLALRTRVSVLGIRPKRTRTFNGL